MLFSERMGITEVRTALQVNGMNDDLRNSLWNTLDRYVWKREGFVYKTYGEPDIMSFSEVLWANYFKRPVDERPNYAHEVLQRIRGYFFNAEWYEVYNFVEFSLILTRLEPFRDLPKYFNRVLEREI